MTTPWVRLTDEVASAVARGNPVVALESTVIAHGLPRPRNRETAIELERIVRGEGAVPATVAVLDGIARLGLTPDQIRRVADEGGLDKLSTRDLPVAVARRGDGATTVAATAALAAAAGIHVFATGGIGGVHHGHPPDVSADLPELQRTPIVVVCAGAKSILDLPATREMLETLGVLVLGWRTSRFPAFYARETDLDVDARVDSAEEVADVWTAHTGLPTPGAILLCAPVPPEAALPADLLERLVGDALERARDQGVRGKAITPFLLARIVEATGGAALDANVALLRNNAAIAAVVARAIASRR